MDLAPYAFVFYVILTEGQSATLEQQRLEEAADPAANLTTPPSRLNPSILVPSPVSPSDLAVAEKASDSTPAQVTRVSPVPLDAPLWRSAECCTSANRSTTARRLRAYMVGDVRGHRTATRRGDDLERKPQFDLQPSNHRPFSYDYASYEIPSAATRRQPYASLESDHDDPGSDDLLLDEGFPSDIHKHDGHDIKPGGGGRGRPVMVGGAGFNPVAIGFIVYLILLSVLQSSILNTSRNGLLGLGLGPLRDRERRDMEAAATAQRRLAVLEPAVRVPPDLLQPVLVAAVLDSEEQGVQGGPRRARRGATAFLS